MTTVDGGLFPGLQQFTAYRADDDSRVIVYTVYADSNLNHSFIA